MEDIRAVCLQVLIQSQAQRRSREQSADCCLAHDERIAAQIIAVEFDQVKGVEENAIIVVPVTDAVERRYPILAARDCLSVDDAGPGAQLGDPLDDERKSVGQVIAWPTVQLHPLAVLAGNDPEAVVLDFVQPLLARRRLRSINRKARPNKPSRPSTRMCEHGSRIGNRWLTHNRGRLEVLYWMARGQAPEFRSGRGRA